jgi:DNA invertase Pin-like site-specific DNA recombinase
MNPSLGPADMVPGARADRPTQIKAEHLAKLAVVYVRQSSPEQVRQHTGSTDDQRGLADLPARWGWSPTRIRIIDGDLGLSGTSTEHRTGFLEMLELIDQRAVGMVLVREVSRLSREPLAAEMFLSKALRAGVLIYADGRVFDAATEDLAEIFGLRIQALLAWFENKNRVRTMTAAKVAKMRQGVAVARPPLGFIRITGGKWVKDPTPDVKDRVQRVFDLARQGQSIGQIVRYLREQGLLFPRHVHGEMTWEPAARSVIAIILRNPNYTPDFYFRRRRTTPSSHRRGSRVEFRPEAEWLIHPDHHEGYVTREQWHAIQHLLASRRPTTQPPVGRGPALLQGFAWCPQCGRWMWTRYGRRRGGLRPPSYACRRVDRWRRPIHTLTCDAALIDHAVVKHVLSILTATDQETALTVIDDAQADAAVLRETHVQQLQRMDAEVTAARRRYVQVDAIHQLVRADFEAALESAIQRRDEVKRQIQAITVPEPIRFSRRDADEIVELTRHLDALWAAPTTTVEDRKQLLRTVLTRVVVHAVTDHAIQLELVWTGGLQERLEVPRRVDLDSSVAELRLTGKSPQAIVRALQAAEVNTTSGNLVSRDTVRASLVRLGLNSGADRRRALSRIRDLLEAGRSRSEIVQALEAEYPRLGRWTDDRLRGAIRQLRKGVSDIPPLPTPAAKPNVDQIVEVVRTGRAQGRSWQQIADTLNDAGMQPPRATTFSLHQVRELFMRHTRRHPNDSPKAGG